MPESLSPVVNSNRTISPSQGADHKHGQGDEALGGSGDARRPCGRSAAAADDQRGRHVSSLSSSGWWSAGVGAPGGASSGASAFAFHVPRLIDQIDGDPAPVGGHADRAVAPLVDVRAASPVTRVVGPGLGSVPVRDGKEGWKSPRFHAVSHGVSPWVVVDQAVTNAVATATGEPAATLVGVVNPGLL